MSTQHTPGPWFSHRAGFSTVYVEARIGGGWLQEVAACGPTEAGQEQQEANARLIAAAPELLEVLLLAPVILHTVPNGECSCGTCEFARARAAVIAKVTGS